MQRVRAVVRAGLDAGAEVYAIYEGYEGMVAGGDYIRPLDLVRRGRHLAAGRHDHRLGALAGVSHP